MVKTTSEVKNNSNRTNLKKKKKKKNSRLRVAHFFCTFPCRCFARVKHKFPETS